MRINLTDDVTIYCRPYNRSKVECKMIQARTVELLGVGLVELASSDCEYASATVMPSKKDIYGNWIETRVCGDYKKINKFTKSDRYAMPTSKENFEAIGHPGFALGVSSNWTQRRRQGEDGLLGN
jgi:hypothetical protein